MTRKAQLVKTEDGWRLRFTPATLSGIAPEDVWQGVLQPGEQKEFLLMAGKKLVLSVTDEEIMIDRSEAGDLSFSDYLQTKAVKFSAKRIKTGDCNITVIQDNGYFEIFAEDGFAVFSVMTY